MEVLLLLFDWFVAIAVLHWVARRDRTPNDAGTDGIFGYRATPATPKPERGPGRGRR